MSLSQHRHDRLAQRLAFIVTQLFKGETLSLTVLAHEFNVSVRTLQRDFNERLIYLDLEYKDGCYWLAKSQRLFRTDKDILQFASMTSMVPFFPSLDRKRHRRSAALSDLSRGTSAFAFAVWRVCCIDASHY